MTIIIHDSDEQGSVPPLFFPHPSRGVEHLGFILDNPGRFIVFEITEVEGMELIGAGLVWY